MANNTRRQQTATADADVDGVPLWKRQSVDRSLKNARLRAQRRSERLVDATVALMGEGGSTDFTVQEVSDRAGMSVRTFYNFFATKDDLLVAVNQTILADEVVPRLRKRVDTRSDPRGRLLAYVEGMYEITGEANPVSRALTTYCNRLAESRPADLARAFQPQLDLIVELVNDARDAGVIHSELTAERSAQFVHDVLLSAVNSRIFGMDGEAPTIAELWTFCSAGIGSLPAADVGPRDTDTEAHT